MIWLPAEPIMNSMKRLTPFLLGCALFAQSQETCYRFRIAAGNLTPAQHDLLERDYDLLHHDNRDGSHDVVVTPERLSAFRALRIPATLVDRGRPYAEIVAQAGPLAPDANYYTPAEILTKIDQLVAQYPGLAAKVDLTTLPGAAKTANNAAIWALKVSDNVGIEEDEPAMLIAAQHHARELNAPVMVIEAMSRVLASYSTDPLIQAVVDSNELYFVPCVNPDGTDHVWTTDNLWRKNRRNNGSGVYGVDNNRNYPFNWSASCGGSTTTSSETYRGPSAGSEPETKTMMAAVKALSPDRYIDFHSYGQDVLFPYGPCITPNATLRSFLNGYITDVMTTLGYSTRASSASGEAPHQHWADRGTLSLLFEVGQAFQPAYTVTITEEQAQVWPGLKKVLTQWRPGIAGHVRSIYQGQGVEAQITYSPNYLTIGEKVTSRARDGRFAMWVPAGTYQVTFSAPGFQPVTKPVTVNALNATTALEVELVPAWTDPTLTKIGTDQIGTTTTFTYTSPGDSGDTYWVALAGGTSPGIPVGSRTVPLNGDGLLIATANVNTILLGNIGVIPGSGIVQPTFPIPPLVALVGLKIYAGGLTLAPGYPNSVKKFSPAIAITFQP